MTYRLLTVPELTLIHDFVLNPGELTGVSGGKSLDDGLARVENRLAYGFVDDIYDVASAYCVAVATGHFSTMATNVRRARLWMSF